MVTIFRPHRALEIKNWCLLFAILFLTSSCRQMWGDNPLGDSLSLLEGDRKEDRIIVRCTGYSGGACYIGEQLIPGYDRHMDAEGHYAEYVEKATSNNDWIIAKSIQVKDKSENYWIIDKHFSSKKGNSQFNVMGPFKLLEFRNKTKELNIDLEFEE
ncbi:DUF3997 domain-containing protein [Chitinophagaceae bacterium LB-8]|uniref:DUF3997 domain-containing protein n=1 Tax=Paraflavisolibacter caeni TaxID=2982496 RepID=A0A9X2XT37_9BACT|nr:hypothetical protein [Paraflavisolibacter caeni]MCU7548295.1 DUF3997 domain-containing protein [Paraflavisolibacter caeni]